jgi:RNA polymerase sigma-70 factor (ECF subfamily)
VVSENELIIRAVGGDTDAYEVLVEQWSQPVFRYIYHYCGYNKTLTQDALQEVFLHLRKNLVKYDQSKPFKPWLWTLARNKTFDRLKSQRRTVSMIQDPFELPADTPK